MKNIVLAALAVALLCGAVGVVIVKRQAARQAALQAAQAAREADLARARVKAPPAAQSVPAPAAAPEVVAPETANPAPESTPSPKPVRADGKAQNPATQANPAQEPLKDPAAREALAWVGADPEAEAYWYGAINNPDLPAQERQDLIEDLNEEGLSDPKHPSPDDLPLIVNRLFLIEDLWPSAMDQVNADAFDEAYKDLLNLVHLAIGGGEPVR